MSKLNPTFRAAAAAVLAVCALGAQAQDKPVELKFAHWLPGTHPLAKTGFEPWAKSVEAASKGSIKIAFFPAQQLGKAADHYDMARDGIADLTWVNPGYQAGRFPMIAVGELPFLINKPGPGSAALDAWYRKYAANEMKDVKLCFTHLHVGTLHSKKPITEPGQIKGMKMRSSNGTNAAFMSLLGGTNVQVSAPEARDALDKGVADALSFPWGSIITFGIDKATKFHTDMRLYASNFVWVMNKGWYDKLAAGQKKVIDDHCNNEWAGKVGAAWGDDEDSGQGKLEKMGGHTIVKLTPAQLDVWKKAAEPLYATWTASADKAGVNGKQALDELRKELAARKD
ncbi:MAG: TRAP transporter substrate-binding protein [Proteobacteria bacterium]|jgi:TRAP-type C4-dicarboxylate transport system substrate-binding protein|nr:TRAP transporter substrate-binding protein [Pseudomonadota bacterium]